MLLATGCSSNDSGGSNSTNDSNDGGGSSGGDLTTVSCNKVGEICLEYSGPASKKDAIRSALNCAEMAGVEGVGCPKEGAVRCALAKTALEGVSGTQYYYGSYASDVASLKSACERAHGTFSSP
ncbi:hypothetical protein AKJ09_01988 [Labilithrix luteola]|uniref:Uncharacterized protein n=1 Tax=Labilithrix luteola TaxID=1391654 RepID=A0A0K1PQD0_9BACT|nr:hypothetical protein AKJ09_01988 [Labilithrix luteola]